MTLDYNNIKKINNAVKIDIGCQLFDVGVLLSLAGGNVSHKRNSIVVIDRLVAVDITVFIKLIAIKQNIIAKLCTIGQVKVL